jgi:Fic-DOC domain mobile mystery protein B
MGLDFNYIEGQTPLDEEEREELLISMITTRGELDEFEQLNVEKAVEWTLKRKFSIDYILTEGFTKELHRKMFGDVWRWAGRFRTSNKNIGVDKSQISVSLKNLFDDCRYWIKNKTYSSDEIAVRFSHRMVSIHPFANGNGRHSRLIADILISKGLSGELFTWGRLNLVRRGEARNRYLEALHEADKNDFRLLLEFAKS